MKKRFAASCAVLLCSIALPGASLAAPSPVELAVSVRGQPQGIFFYAAQNVLPGKRATPVLFAPGDLGMHGAALDFAAAIASWGYDVYGVDTKQYLESFTGKNALRAADVPADIRQLALWVHQRGNYSDRVLLVGWSEGAGLGLLAAASAANKDLFSGIVAFGLTESPVLAWHWTDILANWAGRSNGEPSFRSAEYVNQVAPLRFVLIHSTGDEYTSLDAARRLFSAASEPKRFAVVEARNHRFDGNRDEFLRVLRANMDWVRGARA